MGRQNSINQDKTDCLHISDVEKFLQMTDLSPHLPYGDISPTNNLSSGDFLHMTICHVEKFLHMADFFSTTSGCDGCDKYQVCISFDTGSKYGGQCVTACQNLANLMTLKKETYFRHQVVDLLMIATWHPL